MMESQIMTQVLELLIIIAGIVLVVVLGVLVCKRYRKYAWTRERDHMDGFDFEYYCADLLVADGFIDVQVTRSSGDYGVDILAEKDGVTYAIQCKRYSGLVGVKAVQEHMQDGTIMTEWLALCSQTSILRSQQYRHARKLKILFMGQRLFAVDGDLKNQMENFLWKGIYYNKEVFDGCR